MNTVSKVAIPSQSSANAALAKVDYCDAYETKVHVASPTALHAYGAVFGIAPNWVRHLMRLRGWIVQFFGLRHPFDTRPIVDISKLTVRDCKIGKRLGPFNLISVNENEVLVGDDDKHLNFRISTLLDHRADGVYATVTTAVEIHNLLGRVYMFFVRPAHRFIAPYMVHNAVKLGYL